MRRLEEQVGAVIFVRKGRTMALTEEGLSLLRYARRILALNEEALSVISATEISGPVRFGTIQDLTEELLSEILAHFSRSYPSARLEVTVGNSKELSKAIASGSLDLALLAGTPSKATPPFRRERLLWIGGENCTEPPDGAVPLVLCTEPCRLRQAAIALLEAKGRSWRIAFTSPSISGVKAAVRAGLGITLRGTSFLGPGLAAIEGNWQVPAPQPRYLNIVLGRTAKVPLSAAAQALESLIKKLAADQISRSYAEKLA
jgi:DNA-binding transcriptional LysR family regulator